MLKMFVETRSARAKLARAISTKRQNVFSGTFTAFRGHPSLIPIRTFIVNLNSYIYLLMYLHG